MCVPKPPTVPGVLQRGLGACLGAPKHAIHHGEMTTAYITGQVYLAPPTKLGIKERTGSGLLGASKPPLPKVSGDSARGCIRRP